jgi:hypothetical protein
MVLEKPWAESFAIGRVTVGEGDAPATKALLSSIIIHVSGLIDFAEIGVIVDGW